MEKHNIGEVKVLWATWDIHFLMFTSLFIQILLTFLAPHRKRWANGSLKAVLWVLYLAADAVALYTIGQISSKEQELLPKDSDQKLDLLAFWAPFLLLHLGGPDTITALALQDNELWQRHALQLVTQVVVTIYVFIRSFLRHNFWWPSLLMFVDGSIKYTERTCALYFANMDNFRESQQTDPEAGPNYARLMEEYSSAVAAYIPTEIKGDDRTSDANLKLQKRIQRGMSVIDQYTRTNIDKTARAGATVKQLNEAEEAIVNAYIYYEKFKGLIADSFLSLKDRDDSQKFFMGRPFQEAFKIVEIELNFIYDVFYTKVFLFHSKLCYARIVSLSAVLASLIIFSLHDKSDYDGNGNHGINIGLTFALLGGAVALDIFATVMFVLSDWWIIVIFSCEGWRRDLAFWFIWLNRRFRARTVLCCKRWSRSISQYSLLKRCLNDTPTSFCKCIYKIKKIKDLGIGLSFVGSESLDDELCKFIVEELQKKAKLATDTESTKNACSARGSLVAEDDCFLISECLRPWTLDIDYDESVLIWNLATDLCYQTSTDLEKKNKFCEFSKKLSDYMTYLLLRNKALVSSVVGTSEIRFQDTCEEAKKFMKSSLTLQTSSVPNGKEKRFCESVLAVKAQVPPTVAKGDKSRSVLFDACRLAKQLKVLKECQWEITSKVWVELLAYAAIRCTPRSHVAQLSKGGELITVVWLLMAHLGLGEHFRQNRGFGCTTLVIHK